MILAAILLTSAFSITGQVTFVAHDRPAMGVLQPDDGSPAIWFSAEAQEDGTEIGHLIGTQSLQPGDRVIARGELSRLGFAPGFEACDVEYLGHDELMPAKEVRLRDLDFGQQDNARVALTGVVTGVRELAVPGFVQLHLSTVDGAFSADVQKGDRDWNKLVDAELRLEGTAMSIFNSRREFAGVLLQVVSHDAVQVLSESIDPFSRPLCSLEEILPFSPYGVDLHSRHVKGTVTYVKDGDFVWLGEGQETLKVMTSDRGYKAGDIVEAVGFVTRSEGLCRLRDAKLRKVGEAELPAPIEITRLELKGYPFKKGRFVCYDGRRVRAKGQILSFVQEKQKAGLLVEVDSVQVEVRYDGALKSLTPDDLAWNPSVAVTGVLELRQDTGDLDGQLPKIDRWVLQAESVELIHDDAWRKHQAALTWRYVQWGLWVLVLTAFVAGIAWIVRLRLSRKAVEILANERKRMALDLHDTVEQHLATARMVLNSAVKFSSNVPEGVKTAVAEANDILAHAKSDVRERVMNMRSDVLFSLGPKKVLEALAKKVGKSGVLDVRTHFRGLPEHLGEQVFSEIVFIVGEAITNAIKHGKCRHLVLASDPKDKGFAISIANDGEPFDPEEVLGPESGHYGLSGMRERAKRAGLGLEFAKEGRWMVVRLEMS